MASFSEKLSGPISLATAGVVLIPDGTKIGSEDTTGWIRYRGYNVGKWDSLAIQLDFINVKDVVGTIKFDVRAHDAAAWAPLQTGGTDIAVAIAPSSATVGTGPAGVLTFKSVATDTTGGEISVVLKAGGTAGAETVAPVQTTFVTPENGTGILSRVITVTIQDTVSTAAQVKSAIDANATAASWVNTTVTTAAAMAVGTCYLTGGSKFFDLTTGARYIRAKLIITTGSANGKVITSVSGKGCD